MSNPAIMPGFLIATIIKIMERMVPKWIHGHKGEPRVNRDFCFVSW